MLKKQGPRTNKLLALITEVTQENSKLKQLLVDHQNQSGNFEVKAKAEEINSQYLTGDIKQLREENKRLQDSYNELAINFNKFVTMMEQRKFEDAKSASRLSKFRTVADKHSGNSTFLILIEIANLSHDNIGE